MKRQFGIYYKRSIESGETLGMFMNEGDSGPTYYGQVKFDFDRDPDPIKRRKKNIANARRVLKPRRKWGVFLRHNEVGQCCVTGIRLSALGPEAYNKPLLHPDTYDPMEDGKTLAGHFFIDSLTNQRVAFTALSNIDGGYACHSGYSPELLMLYWLYTQWKQQQHMESMGERSLWLWKKRKIKMVPITEPPQRIKKPALVEAIEPFFKILLEHQGNGVYITEYPNPDNNEVDICDIRLDLRVMRNLEEQYAEASIAGTSSEK